MPGVDHVLVPVNKTRKDCVSIFLLNLHDGHLKSIYSSCDLSMKGHEAIQNGSKHIEHSHIITYNLLKFTRQIYSKRISMRN